MLDTKIAWNQPHFIHEGTFIIGFGHAKAHIAVMPEYTAIDKFKQEFIKNDYSSTNFIFKINWNQPINYNLIKRIIDYNMLDKAGYKPYWRK